ncbi:DUF447 domain-containing protein [Acidianus ambivalens]|uniref:DUF447 family protein n=1 Tax=Acidianus ambivalens TaxID=2283 RepID=A0A650CY69_ACIAM|nr:DUF447 domain-containing protein [Acidianus ambivalens]MQL54836.1 DUF447 family protein [Acidianus ambivalens]QGR22625.1 DUF447 family protein [Acidianus ambivalens]
MELQEAIKNIFPSNGIYEVILGTKGIRDNISPIGVIVNENQLKVKLYKCTTTYQNILVYPYCSINVVIDNPKIFYLALFNKSVKYNLIHGLPVVSDNVIFSNCKIIEDHTEYVILSLDPFDMKYSKQKISAFNRGNCLFIDLLVNITRLDIFSREELESMLKVISYEIKVIKRTQPNLLDIIREIEDLIRSKGYKLE